MRIVAVSTAYPMRGGMAHYMALLYRTLVQRGHEVRVISFSRQYPGLLFPGKTQTDLSRDVEAIPSEAVLDSINPFSWLRSASRARSFSPDVLLLNYWMPFFMPAYATVACLVRLFSRTRVIFLCHNIVPHERRLGDRLFTRVGLRTAHGFVVQTEAVRDDLLRARADAKYRLVSLPAFDLFKTSLSRGEARERLGLDPKDRVVLFFGYVRRYKGLGVLLQAMRTVRESMAVKLVVAGEFYEDVVSTERSIQELGIAKDVLMFDEYIPNEDVGTYFAAADVVTLPYLSATQSGILQISYNFDTPVIVSDVGGLAESVIEGKTGFVVPPGDGAALAQAIIRFFQRSPTEDFAARVREYKTQFSWDRMAEAVESLAADL
ncbi:glycosyltransferase [Candidatus Fermentibacteria bacterium]|nr:glycosyltransferase [Candidatus Fermentibacteria bacterium]